MCSFERRFSFRWTPSSLVFLILSRSKINANKSIIVLVQLFSFKYCLSVIITALRFLFAQTVKGSHLWVFSNQRVISRIKRFPSVCLSPARIVRSLRDITPVWRQFPRLENKNWWGYEDVVFLIISIVKTMTKFSNVIGYHKPDLSTNRIVYASCL